MASQETIAEKEEEVYVSKEIERQLVGADN